MNTTCSKMQFIETPGKCNAFLFTFLFVVNVAVTLAEHPKRVNGTVGQSVFFSASHIVSDFQGYLRIKLSREGEKIADYRCPVKRNYSSVGCEPVPSISDHYKPRTVLFPENASVLLKDLQISDSGIYELSIGDSKRLKSWNFTLRVQPQNGTDIDGRSQTGNGTDAGNTKGSLSTLVFILPAVGIAIIISLQLTIKVRRGCKQAAGQTGKPNIPQYHQKAQEQADTQYAELKWSEHTKEKRNIHVDKESVEYATVRNTSGIFFSLEDRHQP